MVERAWRLGEGWSAMGERDDMGYAGGGMAGEWIEVKDGIW